MFPWLSSPSARLEEYFFASSVEEAIGFLTSHRGEARLIAGGTVLMPYVQRGECMASRLVDVSGVGALRVLEESRGGIHIGSAITLARIAESELLANRLPLLAAAARQMCTPRLRRLATLGGNLTTAVGSFGGALSLVTLGAEAEIRNFTGAQWLPVESLYERSGLSRVDSTSEIVTALRVPVSDGRQLAVYLQLPGQEGSWPELAVAALLSLSDEGRTRAASVYGGCRRGIPTHLGSLQEALLDRRPHKPKVADLFAEGLLSWSRAQEGLAVDDDALLEAARGAFRRSAAKQDQQGRNGPL